MLPTANIGRVVAAAARQSRYAEVVAVASRDGGRARAFADELGVAWDDPAIAADWGLTDPLLSNRDRANPRRADIAPPLRPHASLRT